MKIVISPAKSLDYTTPTPTTRYTQPRYLNQSQEIINTVKQLNPKDVSELMHISDKLGELNYERFQKWHKDYTHSEGKQAVFAFNGDVYSGLDAYSLTDQQIASLQDQLRILSGLYGLLQPLDIILPYRLEMGTSISIGKAKNLYHFWMKTITERLNEELTEEELFINLASKEYASAIDFKSLKGIHITPEFKDYKDGKLKIISFFAKKARGMMVRYIIENNCQTIDDLKGFNTDGYRFDENLSKGNQLIFTR